MTCMHHFLNKCSIAISTFKGKFSDKYLSPLLTGNLKSPFLRCQQCTFPDSALAGRVLECMIVQQKLVWGSASQEAGESLKLDMGLPARGGVSSVKSPSGSALALPSQNASNK